jgi:hypothetical protein
MASEHMNRREFVSLACAAVAAAEEPRRASLFDGKSLDGWIQIENSATSVSSAGIVDPAAFVAKLTNGADPVSRFLRGGMESSLRADLASYTPSADNAKAVIAALVKYLNQTIAGPSIIDRLDGGKVEVRPEAARLSGQNPRGQQLARLNKLVLEDAYPGELEKSVTTGWVVKDGAMASTGSGRGVIYSAKDYSRFRLMFTMRHVSGNPDHQACVLIFCSRPQGDDRPLDALGGIQFQVPNGGHWDYRVGMNNNGGDEFTSVTKGQFDAHQWSRVEIIADATKGIARMAVAQPPGARAIEVLRFHDATAGKTGPIAWQMHNAGLFDEYKDVTVEVDPKDDDLITLR